MTRKVNWTKLSNAEEDANVEKTRKTRKLNTEQNKDSTDRSTLSVGQTRITRKIKPTNLKKNVIDDMAAPATDNKEQQQSEIDYIAGWVVVLEGPGRGLYRPIYFGLNQIGRDESQRICLNFGDDTISRVDCAFIIYDEEERKFFAQHGGKSNLIRVNNKPVMAPVQLENKDQIRLGNTTLLFVPLCDETFNW